MDEIEQIIQRMRARAKTNTQDTTGQDSTSSNSEYKCPICKDREWVDFVDEDGHECMKHCVCHAQREHERSIAFSGISEKFKTKTFSNFQEGANKELKANCMEYVKTKAYEKHESLIIMGQVGSGKTHLAMAIVNNLLAKGVRCRYLEYRSFMALVKQSLTDRETYQRELDIAKRAEVLYIDDFLKGKVTDADLNIMFEIINTRYLADLPVIITTELTPDAIIKFDEGIGSRIMEMASNYILISQGKNKRLEVFDNA